LRVIKKKKRVGGDLLREVKLVKLDVGREEEAHGRRHHLSQLRLVFDSFFF